MQKEKVHGGGLTLVGLTARTNNTDEFNPDTSKIGSIFSAYWGNQAAEGFKSRINPGVTYAVYTDFESDEHGDYTYFLGEAVESLDDQDMSQFKSLVIPAGTFQKFTTPAGAMPDIVISAWQEIWKMTPDDFGGKRKYLADFEVYDQRASDPSNSVIDIYIGIEDS